MSGEESPAVSKFRELYQQKMYEAYIEDLGKEHPILPMNHAFAVAAWAYRSMIDALLDVIEELPDPEIRDQVDAIKKRWRYPNMKP